MSSVAISNDTASAETNKAFDRIAANLNLVSDLPLGRKLLGPAQKALANLHNYTVAEPSASDPQTKENISHAFQELGSQIADALREHKDTIGARFHKFIQRCAACSDRIISVFKLNKGSKKDFGNLSDEFVEDLIRFSERASGTLNQANVSEPAISFRLKRWVHEEKPIEVKQPLKLFQYIQKAHQRNKIFDRPLDNKVKSLVYLAYCIRKHIESNGEHLITHSELEKQFGNQLKHIKTLANDWNANFPSPKRKSVIDDFNLASFTDEEIRKRQNIIDEFNHGRGSTRQITNLQDPNDLLLFLRLTREMQAIKPFYRKHQDSKRNDSFRYHNLAMQWYMQLTDPNPELSLIKFGKAKLGAEFSGQRAGKIKVNWKGLTKGE